METSTRNSTLLLAFIALCSACDKKNAAIESFNVKPQITIATATSSSKSIVDSMRIDDLTSTVKRIKIRYDDGNRNIAHLMVKSSNDHSLLKQGGRTVKDYLPIDQNELELDFENKEEGQTRLDFTITDKLGASDKATYNIFTFKNLAPIAILEYRPDKGQKYILDASKSYDEDRNYGGRIEWYLFKIGELEIKSKTPAVTHFFNEKGIHVVELSVIDNLNQSSKIVSKTIDLNPR